jgi:hypothetical protein
LDVTGQIPIFLQDPRSVKLNTRGKAMPSLSPHLTVGKSGKHPVSQSISILRVVICFALPGCVAQDDTVTPPQSQDPPIVVQPSISEISVLISGPRVAVLTATVNSNYRSTDCYFEYGQNTSYGSRTVLKSIGAGGIGVVVRDTIKGLSWDTTYHCRLVAENPAGRTVGSDQSFICPSAGWVDLVYPLTVGTRWKYTYEWYTVHPIYYAGPRPGSHILGSWLWEVKERTSADSVRIEVLRTESVARVNKSDTVMTWTTSFMASIGQSYYTVRWFELMILLGGNSEIGESRYTAYITVPRLVASGVDMVSIGVDNGDNGPTSIARYVNGKGLVSWRYAYGMNLYSRETLTLDSVWVAP